MKCISCLEAPISGQFLLQRRKNIMKAGCELPRDAQMNTLGHRSLKKSRNPTIAFPPSGSCPDTSQRGSGLQQVSSSNPEVTVVTPQPLKLSDYRAAWRAPKAPIPIGYLHVLCLQEFFGPSHQIFFFSIPCLKLFSFVLDEQSLS